MTKELTAWVKFREIIIFLFIWPVLPSIITGSNILSTFYGKFADVLIILMFIYGYFGWYIAARIYTYRIQNMPQQKIKKSVYSLKKEIGLFLLIWPIAPILIFKGTYFIGFVFRTMPNDILMQCVFYWFMSGWGAALYIYNKRYKEYFINHMSEQIKKKHRIGRFLLVIILTILGLSAFFYAKSLLLFVNEDSEHRDFSPSGAEIRLKISEDECQKYPNRYYFKNLCILCPDEQPLTDGHC